MEQVCGVSRRSLLAFRRPDTCFNLPGIPKNYQRWGCTRDTGAIISTYLEYLGTIRDGDVLETQELLFQPTWNTQELY